MARLNDLGKAMCLPLTLFFCILCSGAVIQIAVAKVPASEAARLGQELTPLGAIQAGTSDGTIPPWEGGITQPPAEYTRGMFHPDPFADDPVLFRITSENAEDYADRLSPGQLAMFHRYPDTWQVNVYPTRRSASFPLRIYDACIENATTAMLTPEGNGVVQARTAPPFPIPQNGLEAVWNHVLRFRGTTLYRTVGQAVVTAGGSYTMVVLEEEIIMNYPQPGVTIENLDNLLIYFLQTIKAPPRLAGSILLVHDMLDQVKERRKAWVYNPGLRRVRRAPEVAYDNPGTGSDGLRTSDQYDMFTGAPDRFDWELIGRQELYVPYNSYKIHGDGLTYDEIIQPGHLNPDHLRYELHRVWVIDARLKEGMRNIHPRRTYYADEDSWAIVVADHYDSHEKIWRVSQAHLLNYYDVPTIATTLDVTCDLQNGRYVAHGLNNEGIVEEFETELDVGGFAPGILRQLGRR
jgi:hypothetical protein